MACLCEKQVAAAFFGDLFVYVSCYGSSPFFTGIYYIFFSHQNK